VWALWNINENNFGIIDTRKEWLMVDDIARYEVIML